MHAQIHEAIELVEALRARIQNLEQELPNRVPAAEIRQDSNTPKLHDRLQAEERVMQPRPHTTYNKHAYGAAGHSIPPQSTNVHGSTR